MQILIFDKAYERIAEALHRRFADAVDVVLWHADGQLSHHGKSVTPEAVAPQAAWFSADVLRPEYFSRIAASLLDWPSIRWVQSANAGLDHPAYAELFARGIRFSKSHAQSIPIAEYVLGYALAHAQNFRLREAAQREGRWQQHRFDELWHSTWLIIGYGHIGRHVARRAKAFDAQTIVVRQKPQGDENVDTLIELEALPTHLPHADVVVLACPATETTQGLVDRAFLAMMKPTSVLINVARGALVDETALLHALDQGCPAHAVLDVFAIEPLPQDHPFWTHPRVTLSAHTSNAGQGTSVRGDELFLSNLARFLDGKEPTDLVNS